MDIVLFCHPNFVASQSMPRFARMLRSEFEARGHRVTLLSPRPWAVKLLPRGRLSKWAAYFDQYALFPFAVRRALKTIPRSAVLVFCDQALGPWVPLVEDRPHVVHVHDLLALRSALGDVPENPTSLTGRIYQRYIRRGFRHGRHFISISHKTREDLHRFGGVHAVTSEVVYNGLNYPYAPLRLEAAHALLRSAGIEPPDGPILLHVGGGQWYKNFAGVVAIYGKYAAGVAAPLPLWCVGPPPRGRLKSAVARLPAGATLRIVRNLDSPALQALYSCAAALLFPSLAEGFGWPLIEAQACGCPVLTTDDAPMNEVAGEAACYIPCLRHGDDVAAWSSRGAAALSELLSEDSAVKAARIARGQAWVRRFDAHAAIDKYLAVYERVRQLPSAECLKPQFNQSARL